MFIRCSSSIRNGPDEFHDSQLRVSLGYFDAFASGVNSFSGEIYFGIL
jgi:hypothetical protein